MKSAAKCANPCELQNTWSIEILNANGGFSEAFGLGLWELAVCAVGPHRLPGKTSKLERLEEVKARG